jgi:hypothetical protein
LHEGSWAAAIQIVVEWGAFGSLVEIAFVGILSELSGHGRDVEAEESATDYGDGRYDVDVPDDHLDGW